MSPYREPAPVECETCLKRKVKSPMPKKTKNWLIFAAFVGVLAGEASVLGTFDNNTPAYLWAPIGVVVFATVIAGILFFTGEID